MAHLFRTTAFGATARAISGDRLLAFPTDKHKYSESQSSNSSRDDDQSVVVVGWESSDDPENPHNWPTTRKTGVSFLICMYTFTIYCGSSIYVPSTEKVTESFGVSETVVSLGLALYVLGYGLGPLLFSPLSEMPYIGRNPIYIITFAIFIILSVAAPLCQTFAGFLVVRFLQGFFGSPCLATGAATLTDMFSVIYIPYSLAAWSGAMYCGPALGPLLSGFTVTAKSWKWSMWELLWLSGFMFIPLFFFLPETSTPTLLYYKAKSLRKEANSTRYVSEAMGLNSASRKDIAKMTLIKPFEITLKDPAIAFVNIYTSFTYGIYYSFFEVFPLVYPKIYGMNLGESSAVFVCVLIACLLGAFQYCSWYRIFTEKRFKKLGTFDSPETYLRPGLGGVFGVAAGMFLFGWAARGSIHWVVPTIGIVIYCGCGFVLGIGIFIYLSLSYPQYPASLFAANDAMRSSFAAAAILFGRPLYINMGVAKGCSLLGGLSVFGVIGFWYLFVYGEKLRKKSRFTVHEEDQDAS
ncbi:MFS domain-containing protein [Fusarium sp. LHS14.1]|nr:MFS domain-containing protein [Fusarium sp. LHS14.1]